MYLWGAPERSTFLDQGRTLKYVTHVLGGPFTGRVVIIQYYQPVLCESVLLAQISSEQSGVRWCLAALLHNLRKHTPPDNPYLSEFVILNTLYQRGS